MTDTEIRLFTEACYWFKQLNDAEPMDCWPVSYGSIIETISRRTGIQLSKREKKSVKVLLYEMKS